VGKKAQKMNTESDMLAGQSISEVQNEYSQGCLEGAMASDQSFSNKISVYRNTSEN